MNIKKFVQSPGPSFWAILFGVLVTGLGFSNPVEAQYTLEPAGVNSSLTWTTFPIETTASFSNMGNKSLRIDTADRPRVVYGGEGLYYATWTGSTWDIKTVDSSPKVGEYASLALDSSNQAYIAYYDAQNADLKYAKWSNTTNSWTIQTVDGEDVNDGKEEELGGFASIDLDSANRPHIVYFDDTHDDLLHIEWTGSKWDTPEKIDSAGVVGLYISMYIDNSNRIHVSYYDFTNKSLKYAVRINENWFVSTVDDPTDEVVGKYSSIDVDFNGDPHVSYFDETNERLKYARMISGVWSREEVDTGGGHYSSIETFGLIPHISYFSDAVDGLRYATKPVSNWIEKNVQSSGNTGYYTSLAVDDDGDVHITYYRKDTGEFRHAELIDIDTNEWDLDTITSSANVGLFTSTASGTNGKHYVSYYDGAEGNLKSAEIDGDGITIRTVDSTGDVGQHTSIALNSSNAPRIAYYDFTNSALKYANWTGSSWAVQTVDNSADVGRYASIVVDANGNAHIAYYDGSAFALKYIVQNGNSWSAAQTLDSVGDVGMYSSIALDNQGYPHIAYYDATNTALKYTYWNGASWLYHIPDNSASVGEYLSLDIGPGGNSHISYYDASSNAIKYVNRADTTWSVPQTVTGLGSTSEFTLSSLVSSGIQATAIKVSPAGVPSIAFYHTGNQELQFAQLLGGGWQISIVDQDGNVGQYVSLDFSALGNPVMSYFDAGSQDLKMAIGLIPSYFLPLVMR